MRALLTTLLIGTLVTAPISSSAKERCPQWKEELGECTRVNNGNEIVINTKRLEPYDSRSVDNSTQDPDVRWVPPPTPEEEMAQCLSAWDDYIGCFRNIDRDDPAGEEDTVEIPAVTISDIARFAPDGTALTGEPANVGVAGLPTNFVATAAVHTVDGDLFGFPVTVRFTPAAYDFTFGDGTTTTTTTGGQTWENLNQPQFTPTPTSHTYTERGTYTAHVNIRYTAEVNFGIGWFPITGHVTATGTPQQIRIFQAHTALVAHTCHHTPTSPGC